MSTPIRSAHLVRREANAHATAGALAAPLAIATLIHVALAPSVTLSGAVAVVLAVVNGELACEARRLGHSNSLTTIVDDCVGVDVPDSFRSVVGGEGSLGVGAVLGHTDACCLLLAVVMHVGNGHSPPSLRQSELGSLNSWQLHLSLQN
jgi:hypothetical protein